jgi:hypothetical protein
MYQKKFNEIVYSSGMYCKECTLKNGIARQKKTTLERYGVEHCMQSPVIRAKASKTNIERYGAPNPLESKEIKEKIKATNLSRYGAENPFNSEEIKLKIKETNLQKYGVEYAIKSEIVQHALEETSMQRYGCRRPSENTTIRKKIQNAHLNKSKEEKEVIQQKKKETSLMKYGTDSPNQADCVKLTKIKSNLEKYGVENPNQSIEIQAKHQTNGYKHKDYMMPSGEIRRVQGFEPFALDDLLKLYTEEQILTERSSIPRIPYSINGESRFYFPDIYIPHENKIIEVKSTWTYACATDNIKEKAAATKENGYSYEIWIYNGKGERVITCDT